MPEVPAFTMNGLDLGEEPVFGGEDLDQLSVYARSGQCGFLLYEDFGHQFGQLVAMGFFQIGRAHV